MIMLEYLKQWNYSETELKHFRTILESGRTVRTTHQPDIDCIYPSDEGYTIIEIDSNGVEREREFESL